MRIAHQFSDYLGGTRRRMAAIVASCVLFVPGVSSAGPIVEAGWDLLSTTGGTMFAGVPFQGVNVNEFDFGSGLVDTGGADTIVERKEATNVANPVPIEFHALQLVSEMPVDLGAGVGFYYVTLQSNRGANPTDPAPGNATTGTMTINFDAEPAGPPPTQPVHGTFTAFFDIFFDLRFGALDGNIVLSGDASMATTGPVEWSHFPPACPAGQPQDCAVEIEGVNTMLNGVDRLADFWPIGTFREEHEDFAARHQVRTAQMPEPPLLVLLGFGIATSVRALRQRLRA